MTTDNPDRTRQSNSYKATQRRTALKLTAALFALPAIMVTGGCGQKGPLYVPESDEDGEKKKASS